MINYDILKRRKSAAYRVFCGFLAFTFFFSWILPPGYAQLIPQNVLNLPALGAMVTPSAAFVPVLLKGMTIYPDDPLKFDFIIDTGNSGLDVVGVQNFEPLQKESEKLVKYFLAAMTIPKDDLWVNLSPYESDKIIPEELGKTELGRDMLAQDYILKQLTASFMYPEKELGKKFWDKIYRQAREKYGTTEIPVNTFNKVWILPETATVYEHGQTVYIVEAKLKVMLDSDYQAMNADVGNRHAYSLPADNARTGHDLSLQTEIIRGGKPGQSSSPAGEKARRGTMEEGKVAAKDELGGIDMNIIDLNRQGAGVDIQFDPVELQEIIDAGIDGFAPVIINITPLPSILPLLGLDPAIKEEPLELSASRG